MAREDVIFDEQRAGFEDRRAAEDIDADEAVPSLSTREPDYVFPIGVHQGLEFEVALAAAQNNPTRDRCLRA